MHNSFVAKFAFPLAGALVSCRLLEGFFPSPLFLAWFCLRFSSQAGLCGATALDSRLVT